ncbi:MAG: DUF4129 domain-containing protein [Myxococcota bacterium]
METERIAVAVRPRGSLEAADLGFQLARACARPLFGAHALVVLGLALALGCALPNQLALAAALVWWLKPLYDRVALYVLSIALFGEAPGIAETLFALPRLIFGSGLLASLTWLRLSPTRSFYAPVLQLEGLRGRARWLRSRVLAERESATAVGLLWVCSSCEMAIVLAGLQLAATLRPDGTLLQFWSDTLFHPSRALLAYELALYALAICAVEPFYVASGFALYVNRRVWLEGWDVELAFRRLERRMRAAAAIAVLLLALAPALRAFAAAPAPCSVDSAEDAGDCIDGVLAQPEFDQTVKIDVWRPRSLGGNVDFLGPIARWVGSALSTVFRIGAWIAIPLVVLLLLAAIARGMRGRAQRGLRARATETEPIRGLDLRPESLPVDVLGAARARFAAGDATGALSLLYRGALVALARRFGLRLPASATEGECERIARSALDAALVEDFSVLARAWLHCAYAHRPPAPDEFESLCARWSSGFGGAA